MSSSESEDNLERTPGNAAASDDDSSDSGNSEAGNSKVNSEKAASDSDSGNSEAGNNKVNPEKAASDSDSDEESKKSIASEKAASGSDSDKESKSVERTSEKAASDSDKDIRKPIAKNDSDKSDSDKSEAGDDIVQNLVLSDSENEAPPEPEIIVDEIPSNRLQLGDLGPIFVRLPNFLSIEPKPFDERTYDAELDDDELVDIEGRNRVKLKVENTIRWRNVKDPETGETKKQSNAKIIKWSDGSMSLYLGAEKFEIKDQTAMPNLHLFTRQGASLQAQSAFHRKFAFQPISTDSLTHRKMTINMADKSNRTQKVKMVTDVGMNPEKARTESIKKEEEKLRALARKQAVQRRVRERTREVGISSGFLEGYDSDEGENIGALKRAYGDSRKGGMNPHAAGGYYSDESEDEDERARKSLRDAKRIESDEDEDMEDSQDSRSIGAASQSQRKPTTSAPKRRIIEDDE